MNAIMTADDAGFAGFAHWRTKTYIVNGHGLYGAIAFEGDALLGTFFDPHSDRIPYRDPSHYSIDRFFEKAPSDQRALAERACLPHMTERVDGGLVPCVTSAFWDSGDLLTAADPWDVVVAEGARLMRIELMEDIDEAIEEWQNSYQMRAEQVEFVRSLFALKVRSPEETLVLTKHYLSRLISISKQGNEAGIDACREKLAAIGMQLPW